MATTRTITGTLYEADGTTVVNGSTVRFKLIRGAWSATEHAIPSEVSGTTTDGAFSITVYTPAEYKVYLPSGYQFNLTVPEGAAVDLESLRLAQEDLPNLTSILDDWLDALALTALADGPGAYDNGKYLQSTADGWIWATVAAGASAWDDITGKPTTIDGYGLTAEIAALIAPHLTQAEADALYSALGHSHNDLYYTEAETDALIANFITQAQGDARYGQLGAANTWALAQTFTGQVLGHSNNTASAPALSFSGDPNTGIYNSTGDRLELATGGSARLSLFNTGMALAVSQTTTVSDATTNASTAVTAWRHNSSGTPAAGFGVQQIYNLESSTTDNQAAAAENVYWSDATHASRTAGWGIKTAYNANTPTAEATPYTVAAQRTGAADSTGLWLYDETAASLKQVTRGAADSGGAGFRLLRVAN